MSSNVVETRDVLAAGGYQFTLRVTSMLKHNSYPYSHGVRVGGPVDGDGCVSITVTAQQEDERFRSALPGHTASLNSVRYSPCCAMDLTLHRGGGTAIMLRAACAYVVRTYPWVQSFRFCDTSTVACGGINVALPALSLCWSGKTWYEKEFGAELEDPNAHRRYRELVKEKLQGSRPSTFEELCQRATPPASTCELVRATYDGARTVQEFFAALKSREDIPFCETVSPWVGDVLDTLLEGMHHGQWTIRASSFSAMEFQVDNQLTAIQCPCCNCCTIRSGCHDVTRVLEQACMTLPIEEV